MQSFFLMLRELCLQNVGHCGIFKQASSQGEPLYASHLRENGFKERSTTRQNKTKGKEDRNLPFPTEPWHRRQLHWENGTSRKATEFKRPRTYSWFNSSSAHYRDTKMLLCKSTLLAPSSGILLNEVWMHAGLRIWKDESVDGFCKCSPMSLQAPQGTHTCTQLTRSYGEGHIQSHLLIIPSRKCIWGKGERGRLEPQKSQRQVQEKQKGQFMWLKKISCQPAKAPVNQKRLNDDRGHLSSVLPLAGTLISKT